MAKKKAGISEEVREAINEAAARALTKRTKTRRARM